MPNARCIICSGRINFRVTRGSKLSNRKCECGGSYERVGGNCYISGKNPFEPAETFTSPYLVGEYYHAVKNSKGEYFYSHRFPKQYYEKISDAVLAAEAVTPNNTKPNSH